MNISSAAILRPPIETCRDLMVLQLAFFLPIPQAWLTRRADCSYAVLTKKGPTLCSRFLYCMGLGV
jgi:hypothetical protein